jgi:hypothetical protein
MATEDREYNEYHQGTVVTVFVDFTSEDGVPTDPVTVTVTVRKPDKTVTTYTNGTDPEVTKLGTGSYQAHIDTEGGPEGNWYYRWDGTGTLEAAEEWGFIVKHSNVLEPTS